MDDEDAQEHEKMGVLGKLALGAAAGYAAVKGVGYLTKKWKIRYQPPYAWFVWAYD